MKNQKHTPGPWVVCDDISSEGVFRIRAKNKTEGLAMSGTKANAQLISAAPEMLEALERCRGELIYSIEKLPWSNARDALKQLDAAIAKARGAK